MKGRPVSQVDIENDLLEWVDHLEVLTNGGVSPKFPDDGPFEGYDDLCDQAAAAEAEWKIEAAKGLLNQASKVKSERKDIQEARVLATKQEIFRAYKMAGAAKEARKEALVTTRNRCDALRTVCANTRTQT